MPALNLCTVTYPGIPGDPVYVYDFPTAKTAKAFVSAISARAELDPLFKLCAPRARLSPNQESAEMASPESDLIKFRGPIKGMWVSDLALLLAGHVALRRNP